MCDKGVVRAYGRVSGKFRISTGVCHSIAQEFTLRRLVFVASWGWDVTYRHQS